MEGAANFKQISILRLLAQGFTIVAGILFAFGIQAWWEERQEEEDAYRLLSSFLVEYKNNVKLVEQDLRYRREVKKTVQQLFALAASSEHPDPKVLDEMIATLFWVENPQATWGALEGLVLGRLPLIENAELREQLAALYTDRDKIETVRDEEEGNLHALLAFLRQKASLPQLANTTAARRPPGYDTFVYPDFALPLSTTRDHSELLRNSEFLGLLVAKYWHQLDASNRDNRFLSDSESLIDLVEVELGTEPSG